MPDETIRDRLARLAFQRSFKRRECGHLGSITVTSPEASACVGCEEEDTEAVRLRMCLACGYVGCCDSSQAKHARRHHEETGHPMIRSIEPGEDWAWCYVENAYLAHVPD